MRVHMEQSLRVKQLGMMQKDIGAEAIELGNEKTQALLNENGIL